MSPLPLTDEQIRSKVFEMPDGGLLLAFGAEITLEFVMARRKAEERGRELRFYAWPDGTLISLELKTPGVPPDPDELALAYKLFQKTVRPLMEAQNGKN